MATIIDRGRFILAALAATVMTLGLTANAQEAEEEADDAPIIEELVVTATYRDTRLMDTPIRHLRGDRRGYRAEGHRRYTYHLPADSWF